MKDILYCAWTVNNLIQIIFRKLVNSGVRTSEGRARVTAYNPIWGNIFCFPLPSTVTLGNFFLLIALLSQLIFTYWIKPFFPLKYEMVKSLTGLCACGCMYVHTLQVGMCGELSRKWQDISIQSCLPYTSDSQTSLASGFILLSKGFGCL